MDEIIFKDGKGKVKMTLKGDILDVKELEKDVKILDQDIETLTNKKKEEKNESNED